MGRAHLLIPASAILTLPYVLSRADVLSIGQSFTSMASLLAVLGGMAVVIVAIQRAKSIPAAFPLVAIAVAGLLPDLAIETRFAWLAVGEASTEHAPMMLASVSGTSRFLIGFALPMIVLLCCVRGRRDALRLEGNQLASVVILFMTALYAFLIFVRGYLWPLDTPILLLMPTVFLWKLSQSRRQKDYVNGDAHPKVWRIDWSNLLAVLLIALGAAVAFAASASLAESFAAIKPVGDGFTQLQWTVPVVSKLPLVAVMGFMIWRRKASSSVSILLITQVTLWSVLVAGLPLIMLLSSFVSGNMELVWFEDRQRIELLLTAAQLLFATALIAGRSFSWKEGLALFLMFAGELALGALHPQTDTNLVQGVFAALYLTGAVGLFLKDRARIASLAGAFVTAAENASMPRRPVATLREPVNGHPHRLASGHSYTRIEPADRGRF